MSVLNDISEIAFKKLGEYKHGIRQSDLYAYIKEKYPNMKHGTIVNGIRRFYNNNTSKVYKPEKDLYKLVEEHKVIFASVAPSVYDKDILSSNKFKKEYYENLHIKIKEKKFYGGFSAWLRNDIEKCTKAKVLGGNALGGKWGTPDIIGVSKSQSSGIIKKELEIISMEIKYSPYELITAFGQACSYKLFCHKVYIAIPKQSDIEGIDQINSLCHSFGIGLLLFDNTDPTKTKYKLLNRAQKGTPDSDFLNKIIEKAKAQGFFNDLLS
jgi:hypothetical protein